MKKQKTQRDYRDYAKRKAVKVKLRYEKPLKNALIFGFSLIMLICMMLPFSKIYVYEGEPGQLGILGGQAVDFPLNTYRILRWAVESLDGGGGGEPSSGINLDGIVSWINDAGIEKLIFGNNDTLGKLMPHLITIVVIGAVLILLQLAQLILAIFGLIGAKRLDYYLNVITLATAVIAVGWLVVAALLEMHGRLLFGIANFSIVFSFGTPIVLALAIGSAVSAFLVKK